uniref:Uncharacterized protein n=1 Tax=Avena sativa TaxID=4498 RepID=A0ACD5ZF25_AVESA
MPCDLLLASSECFALRAEHNGKFLQSVHYPRHGGSRIEASADTTAGDAHARFFLEPSKEHQGLVHIRYCHNNAYWVLVVDSDDERRYMSAANEPQEDLSNEFCTLFEPVPVEGKENNIRLRIPQSGLHGGYASMLPVFDISKPYLQFHLQPESSFIVVGLSRKNELPRHIALKGDNGCYLRHLGRRMQFDTTDINNKDVDYTVHTNDDGTVCIMANTGGYWSRSSSDWICTVGKLAHNMDQDPNMVFKVITSDRSIALANLGNHKFCNRLYDNDSSGYLSASADIKNKWAWFVLEEPIISREISDLVFYLDEARIYNKIIDVDIDQHTNYTTSEQTGTFSFTAKKEVVSTWDTVVSFKPAITERFTSLIRKIPMVIGGEVTFYPKPEGGPEEIVVKQNYTVPPGKTVTAKFVTMQACCDVPYSYKQTDTLTNGKEVITINTDGIYTGVYTYTLPITVTDPEDKVI